MVAEVTAGVRVSVSTKYVPAYSNPDLQYFVFAYRITIENLNDFPVKLLSRHWEIWDSLSGKKVVNGEGVVGMQPLLNPGENYEYESACNLDSEFGGMKGKYNFVRLPEETTFEVNIPEFIFELPFRKN